MSRVTACWVPLVLMACTPGTKKPAEDQVVRDALLELARLEPGLSVLDRDSVDAAKKLQAALNSRAPSLDLRAYALQLCGALNKPRFEFHFVYVVELITQLQRAKNPLKSEDAAQLRLLLEVAKGAPKRGERAEDLGDYIRAMVADVCGMALGDLAAVPTGEGPEYDKKLAKYFEELESKLTVR